MPSRGSGGTGARPRSIRSCGRVPGAPGPPARSRRRRWSCSTRTGSSSGATSRSPRASTHCGTRSRRDGTRPSSGSSTVSSAPGTIRGPGTTSACSPRAWAPSPDVGGACEHAFVSCGAATILHADLDAFYASVEQRDDPSLRGRPVIVGGGVVLAASYEARRRGVRSAMGGGEARRRCPEAVVVHARFSAYLEASERVGEIFDRTTPEVRKVSIDEAFLDVRGLERISGTPVEIAERLRREVREEGGLALTVGIARTRFHAKVASGVAKPDGLLLVASGEELAFLRGLRVEQLWGIGPRTVAKCRAQGIATVREAAAVPEPDLVELLGRGAGRRLHALAHNRIPRGPAVRRGRRSYGAQWALSRRTPTAPEDLDAIATILVDKLARRMRSSDRAARTLVLRLRFGDYTRATRSRTLARATASSDALLQVARELLREALPELGRRGCTLVGLTFTNLEPAPKDQLALPVDAAARGLDAVVDRVKDRYGAASLKRARLVDRDDRGDDVPFPPPPGAG